MLRDNLIKKLLLTHDPDGRRLDSEAIVLAVTSNLYSASFHETDITEIETIGCSESMLCRCSGEGDINSRVINLFDLIGKYSWDAKVVLVLAAFAVRYGEFWQLMQLHHDNSLAALISSIKKLPCNLKPLKLQIKALSLLVETMMDVAMCIIKYSDSAIIAAWELSSLAYRLSGTGCNLRRQVDLCYEEIERNLYQRLSDLARAEHIDNQKSLTLFFPSNNYLPLKDCSTEVKLGVSELKNQIVLLLITKPQLLSPVDIFLLVQKTCDHPLNERLKESYKIVWIPLPSSDSWTEAEESSFNFLSDSLPWHAVRKPRLLSPAVVKYIRERWNYKDEPIMVALDSKGKVTNYNALDMINIWGAKAYPFSASKEEELWQDQNLTMELLLDEINPLLAYWVEQGKSICLYGSENMVWIQQFNDKITELKRAGLQLETIYVGNSQLGEHVKQIMARSGGTSRSDPLSFTNVQFFWLRLASMLRSKLRLGKTPSGDYVLAELSALLEMDDKEEGWVVIGSGGSTDIIRLQGMQVMEFLRKCSVWRENITKFGLWGSPRNILETDFVEGSCTHSYFVPSRKNGRLSQGTVICQVCKRPMKKFVVYKP
ncbi:hypothetical protein V8G54_021255 [Vigna mungo]|uniref:Protein SIEVE ELEMENT OCCLUSION C n=1 Tax=Vigna mungo TaxID=3915 RepID=A0AAQ3RX72_VIGMU